MPATDIGTVFGIDGVNAFTAPILFRDASFPLTNMKSFKPKNEVAQNFPTFMGWWEDDMVAPSIASQSITINTTGIADNCDGAVVRVTTTTCDFVAPNMKHVSLITDDLLIKDLVRPIATSQRNLAPEMLANQVWDQNGHFISGSPYRQNVFRTAVAGMCKAAEWTWTTHAQNGDDANTHQVDGLYTQLLNGWTVGGTDCGDENNLAQVINWYWLTDAGATDENDVSGTSGPDAVTLADKTVTIHGVVKNVPEGLNLAQFLEQIWIDYIETNHTEMYGEVEWEMHIRPGEKYYIRDTVTCMQPCGNDSNYDDEVRDRWKNLHGTDLMQLEPSGKQFVLQQSTELASNEAYFGPRSIAGNPTYALFFQPMTDYFNQALLGQELYGMQDGMNRQTDDFLWKDQTFIQNRFESMAFKFDWRKVSQKCFSAGMQFQYGVMAAQRHLWLRIRGFGKNQTFITVPADTISEI